MSKFDSNWSEDQKKSWLLEWKNLSKEHEYSTALHTQPWDRIRCRETWEALQAHIGGMQLPRELMTDEEQKAFDTECMK